MMKTVKRDAECPREGKLIITKALDFLWMFFKVHLKRFVNSWLIHRDTTTEGCN